MLVLSRKIGQRVRIGELIEVTVLESHRGRVKLGFTCPANVPVFREEILDRAEADAGVRLQQATV